MTEREADVKAYIETLELTAKGGEVKMSSKELAAITGKRHDNVLRDIEEEKKELLLTEDDALISSNGDQLIFEVGSEKDAQNQMRKVIYMNKEGILQMAGRYSAFVRRHMIKRLMVLEKIARFGGREIESYKDLESLYKVMKPIVYFIYEAYDNFSRNDFVDEEVKEYYEEERRKWSKRVHSEEAFTEWWNNLNRHQKDTGIYDRVIMRPSKEEMNK
jgi:hypothetical protein